MPRCRDVGQIHVAFNHSFSPAEHRIDGLNELGAARFVNATGVYPEDLKTIAGSLLSAKLYLLVASLVLASALY